MQQCTTTVMRAALVSALCALVAGSASAQASGSRDGVDFSVRTGLGFAASPTSFLLDIEAPVQITENVSLGPLFQLGLGGRYKIVAASMNVGYTIPLSSDPNDRLYRLRPSLQGGLGLIHLQDDLRPGDDDDTGFAFNVGFGVEYWLTERFALGSTMLFDVMPAEVLGDHFVYTWQIGTARVRF